MDTELARTFLAIVDTGSFVGAAARMHLTQSTVSARMRRLEDWLGAELFAREHHGCTLTDGGRRFQRHATLLARTAEQARRDLQSDAAAHGASLTIGGRPGLWEDFLCRWLGQFVPHASGTHVHALVGNEPEVMQAIADGEADAGILYVPTPRPGLSIELLFEDQLVMVTTLPGGSTEGAGYVQVDWGPHFLAWQARVAAGQRPVAIAVNAGWLGLQHLLAHGGCGYFPLRLLRKPLQEGRVFRVHDAAVFRLPAWLCHPSLVESAALADALQSIRSAAAAIEGIDACAQN